MANLMEATKWLEEGKKIHVDYENVYKYITKDGLIMSCNKYNENARGVTEFTIDDFKHDLWEIYEEPDNWNLNDAHNYMFINTDTDKKENAKSIRDIKVLKEKLRDDLIKDNYINNNGIVVNRIDEILDKRFGF